MSCGSNRSGRPVSTIDLMKKGLRRSAASICPSSSVSTIDLMKKGLRPGLVCRWAGTGRFDN